MDGTPRSNIGVSEMTTTLASSSSLCDRTNPSRWVLPTSSSPSRISRMFTGSRPPSRRQASTALKCMNIWPLSSAAPPGVDLPLTHRRLERRRLPLVDGVHGLHVVVPVEEDGRRALGVQPVAVDDGVAGRLDQPDVLEADPLQLGRRPLRAAGHVGSVVRQRADAGDGEVLGQLPHVAVAVGVDEVGDGVEGHGVCLAGSKAPRCQVGDFRQRRPIVGVHQIRFAGPTASGRPGRDEAARRAEDQRYQVRRAGAPIVRRAGLGRRGAASPGPSARCWRLRAAR